MREKGGTTAASQCYILTTNVLQYYKQFYL